MTGIPCSLDPLGSGFGVPFQPQFVVFEGRPQPEQGGQDNINATVKLYRGIYNVIIAGGGSNSSYGGWAGFDGASGAGFKGNIKVAKTVEVAVQVGAKTNKNTYPLSKPSFIGNFIIAGGATGAVDYDKEGDPGILTINTVDWASVYGTPEIQTNGQKGDSFQPIPGTNYGQEFYTGYLKITYIGQHL